MINSKTTTSIGVLGALHWLITRATGFFTRKLRNQIVIPYLLLATILAVVGTYFLVNSASQSLHERFNLQMLDAAQAGADSFSQMEIQQVAGLRAIAYTQGFSDAIARNQVASMEGLIAPQALNYGFDKVVVVGLDGKKLLNLPKEAQANAQQVMSSDMNKLVQTALHPSGQLDKASAILAGPEGYTFYTVGPVRQGEQVIGAVLVGANLSHVLRLVARDSLSDGVNLYGPAGNALGNTLTTVTAAGLISQTKVVVPPLPVGWYNDIQTQAQKNATVLFRTFSPTGENFVEALSIVPGRSMDGSPIAVYGVTLRTRALDAKLNQTILALVPVFGLGLLFIIILGRLLAAWIDMPVAQLVRASNRVAQGNLEVQVPSKRQDELGVLANRFNDMVGGLRQLITIKDLFGRFVSPEVSEQLLAGKIELGGEQREVTALFSDLRDFTRLADENSATDIVDLLNEYFRAIVGAARKHGGIVNKFGGDSTLIVFGAPLDMPDHAERALATALDMQEALRELNAHRVKEGWEPLRQGIGINTGMVVAGQIGSEDRMEYTVIGGHVNLASRLQMMTKELKDCDIIFSDSTLGKLTDTGKWNYKDEGMIQVRGKQHSVHIYSLHENAMTVQSVDIPRVASVR